MLFPNKQLITRLIGIPECAVCNRDPFLFLSKCCGRVVTTLNAVICLLLRVPAVAADGRVHLAGSGAAGASYAAPLCARRVQMCQ